MEWLNYHHLYYFWVVAREGSIVRATRVLNLTQPTISAQLRLLEESLGEKLFAKRGRGLALTGVGRVAFDYADEIFSLGQQLRDVIRGRTTGKLPKLFVGIADVVPKLIAFRLLEPAFALSPRTDVVCREDTPQRLFASLALNELDLVISDSPIPQGSKVRAFNHLLGESGMTIFAKPSLARQFRRDFPRSLEGAPMLLPEAGSESRRMLDHWFETNDVRPEVVAEVADSALLKAFGNAGLGLFPSPTAIEREVTGQYDVRVVGRFEKLRERFYVVSAERRIKHPAVAAITGVARRLFEGAG
jgi:LysR family transcriptional regulator, transcriptional activator of nhaA